jgi:hypothetical protein
VGAQTGGKPRAKSNSDNKQSDQNKNYTTVKDFFHIMLVIISKVSSSVNFFGKSRDADVLRTDTASWYIYR